MGYTWLKCLLAVFAYCQIYCHVTNIFSHGKMIMERGMRICYLIRPFQEVLTKDRKLGVVPRTLKLGIKTLDSNLCSDDSHSSNLGDLLGFFLVATAK